MSSTLETPPDEGVTPASPPVPVPEPEEMSHRQIVEALVGILSALFVGMISSTIVSNALPTIISDLDGTQRPTPG